MKTNDYVKFVTQEMMKQLNQPREALIEQKRKRKAEREPRTVKWFGMIPLSVSLWFRKNFRFKK